MEQNDYKKREHPRYTVSNLSFVKARIDRSSSEEQILTLGNGGCGFVGFNNYWEKSEIKRVVSVIEFKWPKKIGPIQIQGNIIYSKSVNINGRRMYYFGVQFLRENAHLIQPLIDALQDLNSKGQINIPSS